MKAQKSEVDRVIPCAMRTPMREAPLIIPAADKLGSHSSRLFSHRAWNARSTTAETTSSLCI